MGAKTDRGMGWAISPADGRRLMTPDDFVGRHLDWRADGTPRPLCPVCEEPVTPNAVNSPNMQNSFHHRDRSECPKSKHGRGRFPHIDPEEFDLSQEKRLLFELRGAGSGERVYRLCHDIAGHLAGEEFEAMLRVADKLHIWRYKGMTLDLAGFVLPTLIDMKRKSKNETEYTLRIVVRKPRGYGFFFAPERCTLEKIFADSGHPMQSAKARIPVLDPAIISKADTSWEGEGLKHVIRRAVWSHSK